jgi:pantothenate kinase
VGCRVGLTLARWCLRVQASTSMSLHAGGGSLGRRANPSLAKSLPELVRRVERLVSQDRRALFGNTGPPGVGKSTLASGIVCQFGYSARLVEMDGFHLPQARRVELGRLGRIGAIDTFDGDGFGALIRSLRRLGETTIYSREFRRDIGESIEAARAVEPRVQLGVAEGNYLLVPERPWGELRDLFDEVWYGERDKNARVASLIDRHIADGKSADRARPWVLGTDQRNAELIAGTQANADVIAKVDSPVASDASRLSHGLKWPRCIE